MDWIIDHPIKALLGLLAVLFGLVWLILSAESKNYQAFMTECLEHRPRYECTSMWRSSQPDIIMVR